MSLGHYQRFNKKAFREIPILFFQGGADENDSVPEGEEVLNVATFGSDSYDYEQTVFINKTFGERPVNRVEKVKNIYLDFGVKDFKYIIIPDIEHITKPFEKDVLAFLKKHSIQR